MASKSKAKEKKHNQTQQQYEDGLFESDDTFAFIAGYTAGGFPYGITWEKFWDLDIIGIREGAEEDTAFYSILGHGRVFLVSLPPSKNTMAIQKKTITI